jgi:osmotically-inducible protein OsmY
VTEDIQYIRASERAWPGGFPPPGEIDVKTFKGMVQSSGFVCSRTDINKVAELARSINGIKTIKNDMRMK